MKKLTTSVLAVVLSSSFAMVSAQTVKDTAKTTQIEEVVITGALGLKKKKDAVTSAQQVVSGSEITQAGAINAVQALTGKVAGLQIAQSNGGVVESNSILLRGRRTITGNNEALIVIDNVISTASIFSQLTPDVIESVNVIKGAQGAALYGSDGVNGVIVVTTRRGARNSKLNVVFNSSTDFESVSYLPKRQRKYGQGWDGEKIAVENGAWGPAFDDPTIGGTMQPYGVPLYDYNGDGVIRVNGANAAATPDTPASIFSPFSPYGKKDNLRSVFDTGTIISNDVTINAGGDGKYFMLSLGQTDRKFVVPGDIQSRTNVLMKGGATVGKWSFDGSLNYIRRKVSTTNADLYQQMLQTSQDMPLDKWKDYPDMAYASNVYYRNPYWKIKHERFNTYSNIFNAVVGTAFKVDDHISFRYTGNLQYVQNERMDYRDAFSAAGRITGVTPAAISASFFSQNNNRNRYYGDLMANFNYDIVDDLNLQVAVGHNYKYERYNVVSGGGNGLVVPGLYTLSNVLTPTAPNALDNFTKQKNSQSLFANVDLAYKDFLFLNATARNEWSSVLSVDNRSFFYPSVGLSFIPTKAFGFGGDILNYMKISGGWTRVGNSSAADWYDTTGSLTGTAWSTSGSSLGYTSYRDRSLITDPNLRPEFVTTTEASLDLGFFKDRITLSASVYQADTDDLITTVLPAFSSWGNYPGSSSTSVDEAYGSKKNIGKMRSRGFEVNLGLVPIKSQDFKWDLNLSFANTESRILELAEGVDSFLLQGNANTGVYAQVGSLFPLIKAIAYDRDDQGRIKVDPDGNPLYTSLAQDMGTTAPKNIYGLTTSIQYKGIRLSAVMEYRTGNVFYSDVANFITFNGGLMESADFDRTQGGFVLPNSVIQDTNGNWIPNTSIKTGGNDYTGVSEYYSNIYNKIYENYIYDASAFKIREIALGYTIGRNILGEKSLINEMTFTLHARNPFFKYAKRNLNYSDPETTTAGAGNNGVGIAATNQYPSVRTFGASLNLKF